MMPPFARLAPPTETIPEEVELVWDDSVAPETCIDLDAPQMSGTTVVWSMFAVTVAFSGLYAYVVMSDPEGSNPVARRAAVIPHDGLKYEMGISKSMGEEEEE